MFSFLAIAALAAAATASPAGSIVPDGRIFGGSDALIEDYPYQIALESHHGFHKCGGSIISPNYVLTACHCVLNYDAAELRVRTGATLMGKGGIVHEVAEIIRHEEFAATEKYNIPLNDVALLRLKRPITYDKYQQPIELFEKGEASKAGTMSTVTGWGLTELGRPELLQIVNVPVFSKLLCKIVYKPYGGLPHGQMCAAFYGVGGKDACMGDSGGPLAIGGRLAGISSWGYGCGEKYYPGVYTEVADYRDWIAKHVEL